MNKIGEIKNKNILFLQGPIGSFFRHLDLHFRTKGANTLRITLNSSDWFFSNRDNTIPFKGRPQNWFKFIKSFLIVNKIDKIFLSGDCRFYQRIAIKASMELNIDIFVFEEGYIRPNFITMERYGVNNFSKISRDPNFYLELDHYFIETKIPLSVHTSYKKMEFSAIIYYIILFLFKFSYPHYVHYRESNAINEFFWGVRNIVRKGLFKIFEWNTLELLETTLSKKYYFVPLQTYNDFQLTKHSSYKNIEAFIMEVLESFEKYAPKDMFIVFKHHPVDRGRRSYRTFIKQYAKKLNIAKKVIIIHDLHLPTCLKNAKATITINSTVGISSLYHGIPTITLGEALYNMKGLTAKEIKLDDFWINHPFPNNKLFIKFKNYLIDQTQLNGSFYGLFPVEFNSEEMFKK